MQDKITVCGILHEICERYRNEIPAVESYKEDAIDFSEIMSDSSESSVTRTMSSFIH